MSLLQKFARNATSTRTFMKSAIRRDAHDVGGEPGKNLPFDVSNRFKFTLIYTAFISIGMAIPFLADFSLLPKFGFFFDIDGVIVRGKDALPSAVKGFRRLVGPSNRFRIPTVFVTNDGYMRRQDKADELTQLLGINIQEDQIVLAHSPMSTLRNFQHNRMLISGQGQVKDIAMDIGFRNVVTMENLIQNFPSLDYVNKSKRIPINGPVDKNFEKIEGIILINEPINWETSLQLIIDLLLTNGMPTKYLNYIPYPHIPVIACNMDLLWMSKAPIPRYGHGAFLLCLESLYEKVTNQKMIYTELVGKPSILTYSYANALIQNHAKKIGIPHTIETIYAVGDNINTDVCGANLYNQHLTKLEESCKQRMQLNQDEFFLNKAKRCHSILVNTGVHSTSFTYQKQHSHRDFIQIEDCMSKPNITTNDASTAIDTVFQLESFK